MGLLDAIRDPQFQADLGARARAFAMMPDQSSYGSGGIPDQNALGKMQWADLIALRKKFANPQDQNALAPFEHRAYMREFTDGPASAIANAGLAMGYTPYKAVTGEGRSQPQLSSIGQGLLGVWEGLAK